MKWVDMRTVLPEQSQGVAAIKHFNVQSDDFRAMLAGVHEGNYVKLMVEGDLMMSNTTMEKSLSLPFMVAATGDVLICGLGLGMCILPLLENDNIRSITVIEKYEDVIDLVLPYIKPFDTHNKLTVICADCFDWEPSPKTKYDTIFIDIWPYINQDVYEEEMKPLKQKYFKYIRSRRIRNHLFVWAERQARYGWPLC